ncbi:MAG TPA: aldehyde dehydrogenase family protein, partial [Streptosporangiaceae bacterium]
MVKHACPALAKHRQPSSAAVAERSTSSSMIAADFPPGVFNLVTGTGQVAEMLAAHPGVDIVAVAGPTSAGRRIAAICG